MEDKALLCRTKIMRLMSYLRLKFKIDFICGEVPPCMHRKYFLKCDRQQLCYEILRRLQMEVRWRKSDSREKKNFEFEWNNMQKQPSRSVLSKTYSENMQQIYRRTPMQKCDFNKVAKQLHWTHTSVWVFSFKFAAYFQNTFY